MPKEEQLPCFERLHQDAYFRANNRITSRKLLDTLMESKLTTYHQTKKPHNTANLNLYQKTQSISRRKRAFLDQISENLKKLDEEELTFHPKICENSKELLEKKFPNAYDSVPACIRLYQMARKNQTCENILPSQNDNDSKFENHNFTRQDVLNFLRRVEISEYFRQKKISMIKENTESDMTFKPRITSFSQKILASDPIKFCETLEERIERLAVQDVKKREIKRTIISKQFQYEFHPKISKLSKILAMARVEKNKRKILNQDMAEMQIETPILPPTIEKQKPKEKFPHLKSEYKDPKIIMVNIKNHKQQRERELELEKERENLKEISQCTFQPEIRKKNLQYLKTNSTQVKGLPRFFELKSLAAQYHEKEKERYSKVFCYDPNVMKNIGTSVNWK